MSPLQTCNSVFKCLISNILNFHKQNMMNLNMKEKQAHPKVLHVSNIRYWHIWMRNISKAFYLALWLTQTCCMSSQDLTIPFSIGYLWQNVSNRVLKTNILEVKIYLKKSKTVCTLTGNHHLHHKGLLILKFPKCWPLFRFWSKVPKQYLFYFSRWKVHFFYFRWWFFCSLFFVIFLTFVVFLSYLHSNIDRSLLASSPTMRSFTWSWFWWYYNLWGEWWWYWMSNDGNDNDVIGVIMQEAFKRSLIFSFIKFKWR